MLMFTVLVRWRTPCDGIVPQTNTRALGRPCRTPSLTFLLFRLVTRLHHSRMEFGASRQGTERELESIPDRTSTATTFFLSFFLSSQRPQDNSLAKRIVFASSGSVANWNRFHGIAILAGWSRFALVLAYASDGDWGERERDEGKAPFFRRRNGQWLSSTNRTSTSIDDLLLLLSNLIRPTTTKATLPKHFSVTILVTHCLLSSLSPKKQKKGQDATNQAAAAPAGGCRSTMAFNINSCRSCS